MTKNNFLDILKFKISILDETEINDILNEYSGYIDEAIADGKSEEEAINDFGSIDELATEILKAYKINTKKARGAHIDNAQVKHFVDDLSKIIGEMINYMVTFLNNILKDYSIENLTQILVLFIVGLVLIIVCSIPFTIIKVLGNVLISIIVPFGFLESIFSFFWCLIVDIIQLCVSICIIVSLIKSGLEKKSVNESVNEILHGKFDFSFLKKKSHPVTKESNTYSYQKSEIVDIDVLDEQPNKTEIIDDFQPSPKKERSESEKNYDFEFGFYNDEPEIPSSKSPAKNNIIFGFLHLVYLLVAGMFALTTLPLFICIIILCCVLGFGIYLLTQGVIFIGAIILIIALIILLSSLCDFILKLTSFSKKKFQTILIGFGVSCVILCVGSIITITEFSQYQIIDKLGIDNAETITATQINPTGYDFPFFADLYVDGNRHTLDYMGQLEPGEYEIRVTYDRLIYQNVAITNDNGMLYIEYDANQISNFARYINLMINDLKQKKVYSYNNVPFSIEIYKK